MEIKENSRRKGRGSRLVCPLLAFVLAFGLIIAVPGLRGKAEAVDFNKNCSLTIAPGGPELSEDLAGADVVVDIYKVADAVPVSGYDTYTYNFASGYEAAEEIYGQEPEDAEWSRMAQAAAKYALENSEPLSKGNPVNRPVGNLGCGLYLLIARGDGIPDYTTTVTTEDGTANIATLAYSDTHVYTFAPELISLPSKQITDEDGTQDNTTAGNGEWDYDMDVTLKPTQGPRFGSLEIVKNLETYNQNIPAVFVFQVEAELNGKNVYSDVVTLNFTEAGQKKALIERIPVGANVKVTEVYSGASYRGTSADEQNAVIDAADVVSVEFSNDYSTTTHGGGGVNNHFIYDAQNGWQLEPQVANRTDGE